MHTYKFILKKLFLYFLFLLDVDQKAPFLQHAWKLSI